MGFEVNLNALGLGSSFLTGKVQGGKKITKTAATTPLNKTSTTNSTTRADLSSTAEISNKARMNAPEANGLASANEISKGELVSGYHFDSLDCDMKAFTRYYSYANAPQIAKETQEGCENIEYAGVAAEISQSSFLEALDKLTV